MNFNGAQIHLLLNHFPVVGYPILLILFLWGHLKKEPSVFLFGVYLSILIAVTNLGSYLTGEGAEDTLRELPDFSIELIHSHEDMALIALIASIILAVFALCVLPIVQKYISWFANDRRQNYLRWMMIVGAAALSILLSLTAHLGGLIRHIEIR